MEKPAARERWTDVARLFEAALERPPAERAAFLHQACTEAPEVRAEVEALLAQHTADPQFLADPLIGPPPAATPALAAGRRIGPYEIVREIGRGGMGIVYEAHDTRLHRTVAIKALPADVASDPQRRDRLRREARAAAAISHPDVAAVFALEEDGDDLYVVHEFVRGGTLRAAFETEKPFPLPRLVHVMVHVARGLAAAHSHGVVHRDLKPENVMLGDDGLVKVVDFGLARFDGLDATQDTVQRLTRGGMLLGTPAYMAPEQLQGQPADFRVDIFALGVMLYEGASGEHPFEGRSLVSTIARILTREPESLTRGGRLDAAAIGAIVDRCLRKNPTERYDSTTDLVGALERARDSLGRSTRPSPSAPAALADVAEPASYGSPRWWWSFHQRAVAAIESAILIPLGFARLWAHTGGWGRVLFYAALVAGVVAVSLRLHLSFASRYRLPAFGRHRSRLHPWIVGADLIMALALISMAALIEAAAPVWSIVFVIVALALVIALAVIEPATTRAAFGDSDESA